MNTLIVCSSALAVAAPLGVCALYLRRIAKDARAIRKLLQARWDYEMEKINLRIECTKRVTPRKTSRETPQQHEPAKGSLSATDAERYLNQISDRLTVNRRDEH